MIQKFSTYSVVKRQIKIPRAEAYITRAHRELVGAAVDHALGYGGASPFFYCSNPCSLYTSGGSHNRMTITFDSRVLTPLIGGTCRVSVHGTELRVSGLSLSNDAYLHRGDLPVGSRVATLTALVSRPRSHVALLQVYDVVSDTSGKRKVVLIDSLRVVSKVSGSALRGVVNLDPKVSASVEDFALLSSKFGRAHYDRFCPEFKQSSVQQEVIRADLALSLAGSNARESHFMLEPPTFSYTDTGEIANDAEVQDLLETCNLLVASSGDLTRVQGDCWGKGLLGSTTSPAFSEVLGEILNLIPESAPLVFFDPAIETESLGRPLVPESLKTTQLGQQFISAGYQHHTLGDCMAFSLGPAITDNEDTDLVMDYVYALYPGVLLSRSLNTNSRKLQTSKLRSTLASVSVGDLAASYA